MQRLILGIVFLVFTLGCFNAGFGQIANTADIVQIGSDNEASVSQTEGENQAKIVQVNGTNNIGIQIQEGHHNGYHIPGDYAVTTLMLGNPTVFVPASVLVDHQLDVYGAYVKQDGDWNFSKQQQRGNHNRNYIWQNGSFHNAEVIQEGDHLVHSLKQYGQGCGYTIMQNLATPIVIVTQSN